MEICQMVKRKQAKVFHENKLYELRLYHIYIQIDKSISIDRYMYVYVYTNKNT